ncbi:hypothetical protein E6O75_ATG05873 [Venturia nashicola]|uniref:Uncharacterized protein n=1 Tax=Venturia nashicola TaxID=86259 RepID=A0A4Z1NRL2_9PEZI|nr:hypothetical protein E6O75_ATG05873 [Venturia nashicola]
MAPKKRNAAQALTNGETVLPHEPKKKRGDSKQTINTYNTLSEIEVGRKAQATKVEKGAKQHKKGLKNNSEVSKDEHPSKRISAKASSKPQHSTTMKKDGNHNTIELKDVASISQENSTDRSETKSKPRKRQALRAPVLEKGWGTGEIRWFRSEDFDGSFFVKGVTEVNFDGFVFTNAHANAIISASKKFRKGLDMLNAGWIDDKGITDDDVMRHTDEVTNETLVDLAKACPNLTSVYLYGRLLSDLALQSFFQHCPKLESFTICSNSIKTNGKLRGSALKALRKNPDWTPELWKLCLHGYDGQNKKLKRAISKLTTARPELFIDTEDNVTRLSSKSFGGHKNIIEMPKDDEHDEEDAWESDVDASNDDDNDDDDSWNHNYSTLNMGMIDDIFGDSPLGDFMFNQYANGNNMDGFMF